MKDKIEKAGYTLVELLIVVIGVAGLAAVVLGVWVAVHFIRKYW